MVSQSIKCREAVLLCHNISFNLFNVYLYELPLLKNKGREDINEYIYFLCKTNINTILAIFF